MALPLLRAGCVPLLLACALPGASKRDWKEGKVVQVDSEKIAPPTNAERFFYTIDTGPCLLVVTEKAVMRWSHPMELAAGDKVKWAMRKQAVYLIAPNGNERTLSLRRQECKGAQ